VVAGVRLSPSIRLERSACRRLARSRARRVLCPTLPDTLAVLAAIIAHLAARPEPASTIDAQATTAANLTSSLSTSDTPAVWRSFEERSIQTRG
jgi:hypothetical protein